MLKYIFLVVLIGGHYASGWSSSDLNDLIDQVLDLVRPTIVDQHLDEVDLGSLDFEFSQKVWLLTLTGSFSCSGGRLRSLSSAYRTGGASADVDDKVTQLSIEAPLGLRVLAFEYQRCSLEVKNLMKLSAPVTGSVEKSSLDLTVTAVPEEHYCTATISRIELRDLSGISVSTGSDLMSKLRDELINKLLALFRAYIFSSVDSVLQQFQGKEFHFTKDTFSNLTNSVKERSSK